MMRKNERRFARLLLGGLGLLWATALWADADSVRQLLQSRVPRLAAQVKSVAPAHVLGLYEIYTEDRQILYTDEGVNYLFAGDILDARSLKNLSEERLSVLGAIKPESLPLNLAMKRVKGNGKRLLVLFSDPDCPYCRKFEHALSGVTDVTVYTFFYPIASLHSQAPDHARSIWCASNPQKAWEDYLLRNVKPPRKECDAPLQAVQDLAAKYRFNGTPTLILQDGQVLPGAISQAQLEQVLGPR